MRRSVAYSLAFHVAVAAVAYFGLPRLSRPPAVLDQPLMVDIVNVDDKTNAPPPKPREEPKKEPEKPPPEPPKAAAPPPPPPPAPPKPEPAPQVAARPPEPVPIPEPKPKPAPKEEAKPEPKPEPKPAPPPPSPLADVKPKKKPKPPEDMTSVLKTLEDLKRQPTKTDDKAKARKKAEPEKPFDVAAIQKDLQAPKGRHDPSRPVSISEIDLVRRQIAACWNLPAGAKEARNMTVEIRVTMNPDGTVRDAQIQDNARMTADPFYRAMAESALRAVLNPRCQPFKLPKDRYDVWQTLALNFDPREML